MIALVEERRARIGIAPLCDAVGLARATFYRRRGDPSPGPAAPRDRRPPRQALTPADREGVLALLHETRFVDLAPAQVDGLREGYVAFGLGQNPYLQGFYPVMMMYHEIEYGIRPITIDTGTDVVTPENVDEYNPEFR